MKPCLEDECTAVGKTDVNMHIVLSDVAKPVRAHIRKIKPSLEQSLHDQLDSWLRNGFNIHTFMHT